MTKSEKVPDVIVRRIPGTERGFEVELSEDCMVKLENISESRTIAASGLSKRLESTQG